MGGRCTTRFDTKKSGRAVGNTIAMGDQPQGHDRDGSRDMRSRKRG